MTMIEDELRTVLDGFSESAPPTVDRRTVVGAKIKHHQRVRTTGVALAVVMAVVATGGAVSASWLDRPHRKVAPAGPVYQQPVAPGHLPTYFGGGKLIASGTATMPTQTTISITFVPETWDFMADDACAAPDTLVLNVSVNGHPIGGGSCGPNGGPGTEEGEFDQHSEYWESLGVHLGEATTLTAEIGAPVSKNNWDHLTPTTDAGLASIGIYTPVDWGDYHFPPKPAGPQQVPDVQANLNRMLVQLNGTLSTSVKLPRQIEIICAAATPGLLSVYLDGVQVGQCDSWVYGSGVDGGRQDVGKGRLSTFIVGQSVTVTVVATHFPSPKDWQVTIYGP